MQEDLISVIVPVYNVEKYLDRCIRSIVKQTYSNLDIILVDDGSTDKCSVMCDAWAEKDSRIRVIHKKNGGLSDARNKGMDIAIGKFISFVDSDDWIAMDMYKKLVETIQRDKSDIAACSVKMIWEDETPEKMLTQKINCLLDKQEAQLELLREKKIKQPVWYKIYRKDVIDGIEFEKGRYHEDTFWSYRVIGNAEKVSIIDYIGYYYWQRTDSIMGKKYSLKRLDAIAAKVQRQEYLKKNYKELAAEGKLDLLFSCIYHGQISMRKLNDNERKGALFYLSFVFNQYFVTKAELRDIRFTKKCWLMIAKICFPFACRMRNCLKVGI